MSRRLNLIGRLFGRLDVLSLSGKDSFGRSLWRCQCRCKKRSILIVQGGDLTSYNTKSCGCWNRDHPPNLRHGANRKGKRTREYRVWAHMVERCTNPNYSRFKDWGGRGIKVHPPWLEFGNFFTYIVSTIGLCPPGKWIDRIDNDGNYEPGNVKWSTPKESSNNTRRNKP